MVEISKKKREVATLQRKIKKIDEILDARPLREILDIHAELSVLLQQNPTAQQRTAKALEFEKLYKRKEKAEILLQKQKNTDKLITEKIDLQFQISKLETDIYLLQR